MSKSQLFELSNTSPFNSEISIFQSKVTDTGSTSLENIHEPCEGISILNIVLCLVLVCLIVYFAKLSNDRIREYFKSDDKESNKY